MLRRTIAVLLLTIVSFPIEGLPQTPAAPELASIIVVLQQLKSQLESVINTADQETAARIRQLEIVLDGTIAKVKEAMDHGYGLINNSRDQLMGNIATLMIQAQAMLQDTASTLLLGVNDTLANLARVVTAVPGISIPSYIYAVMPLRFQPNQSNAHVEVHGFFPDVSKEHPVVVRFANGRPIMLDSYINNTLAFQLPGNSLLKEDTFVTMTFDIPVKHLFGAYYSTTSVKARVYVESEHPFSFSVTVNTGNPNQWATIRAASPLIERADSSRTTNNQTFTAPQVFSTLVNDNVHYDMSSAEFVGFSALTINTLTFSLLGGFSTKEIELGDPIHAGENPCASGCTSSSGSWSWDSLNLRISLSAPSCAIHTIWPSFPQTPYQCGGGTNAEFEATPTFRARKRGMRINPEVEDFAQKVVLGHNRVSLPIVLPENWISIDIVGRYKDGNNTRENFARLTSGDAGIRSANEAIFWKAEISGQSLVLSSH